MTSVHRFFDWLGDRTSTVILTPCVHAIGNCSEEIQFGIIKANRERKRLILLAPFDLFWKWRFRLPNEELLDLAHPQRLELSSTAMGLCRLFLTLAYASIWTVSKILHKAIGRPLPGRFTHPSIGTSTLWKPTEEPSEFRWDLVDTYEWRDEIHKPLDVRLKARKRAAAHAVRLAMDIPAEAWFVSLHVRGGGFHNDHAASACRNATIENFLPAIEEITSRGGWVVRLGDNTMTPLPRMDRVVDYPHTRFKSALMDLYFLSECRFYIGMSSGILDTAFLFQRPMIITNMTNMTFVYPRKPGDRGIPKHVYSKSKGRFLSLREILEGGWRMQHYFELDDDIVMHENSPAEILAVVKEFLDQGDKITDLQLEFNTLRVLEGRRILDNRLLDNRYDDMHNRYRYASRLESSLGAVGHAYLEANFMGSPK